MILAALLLAAEITHAVYSPIELPPANEEWVRLATPRFDIISSTGERDTRDLARDLETLAEALADIRPASPRPPATRVYVFARRREVQPYFEMLVNREKTEVSGLFFVQDQRGAMLIDESRGPLRERTPYHELVHYLIGTAVPRPPLWLEEGVAEYYSSAEVRGGIIRVGVRIREHMELLRHRKAIPVETLFAAGRESEIRMTTLFYAEAWAIVDWMIHRDRATFDAFMRDVTNGMTSEAALQKHFHKTVPELQRLITSNATSSLPEYPTTLQVTVPEIAGKAVKMSRADVLYEFGRFLGTFETTHAQAEEHFRAALAANPKHARTLAALGEFEQAMAADPSDGEIVLQYAENLLEKEIGAFAETHDPDPDDEAAFRRARELAQKSLALGADRARALGAVGASYTVEDDPKPGIAPLEGALALAPNRNDFALHLLAFYRRAGDRAKSDALYARLLTLHDKQVDLAARAVMVRTDLARVNALIHDQKFDEAAVLLRQMSAATPDAAARKEMDDQALRLESDAIANREIAAYNLAVELYNGRDLPGAKKIVDDLLKSATDPKVIADAAKLQELIRERLKHR